MSQNLSSTLAHQRKTSLPILTQEDYSHKARRTKIVATLGPASIPHIKELIEAGVNVFRLNFSHTSDPTTFTPVIKTIRSTSSELGIYVAILGDLCGPKIRCNIFQEGLTTIPLVKDQTIRIKASNDPCDLQVIRTSVHVLVKQLDPGHRVLFDDGNLCVRITNRLSDDEVEAVVVVGGNLKPKKGMNVPDIRLNVPALTEKDKVDAKYAFEQQLEYVALSFVQLPEDVKALLTFFEEIHEKRHKETQQTALVLVDTKKRKYDTSWRPLIVSKIEKPQALERIDEIIAISDGIMVARGDMGVECSLERVPLIQKALIRKCNAAETPVITATQMLESMITSPMPTRAEVSDVANAVYDGTDAIMLSGESAVGAYPVEAVKMMDTICLNVEGTGSTMKPLRSQSWESKRDPRTIELGHPVADAAVQAAEEGNAKALIVFTFTGDMAHFVSARRPERPIIAMCPFESLARRLCLHYGIYPAVSSVTHSYETNKDINTDVIYQVTESDIVSCQLSSRLKMEEGDFIVYCAGRHQNFQGLAYTVKISKFGTHRSLYGVAQQILMRQRESASSIENN